MSDIPKIEIDLGEEAAEGERELTSTRRPRRDGNGILGPWTESRESMDQRLREIEERYEDVSTMSSPTVGSILNKLREPEGRSPSPRDRRTVSAICGRWSRRTRRAWACGVRGRPRHGERLGGRGGRGRSRCREAAFGLATADSQDPNAGKNVVVEIRAAPAARRRRCGRGELFEMYRRYAERHRWRTDVLAASPSDAGDSRRPSSRSRARTLLPHEARIRGPPGPARAGDGVERADPTSRPPPSR